MRCFVYFVASVSMMALMITGCARSSASSIESATATKFQLSAEPQGAVEVLDVKESAQDGQPVVVVGRLGGGVNPWVEGRAAFLIVDTRILPSCDAAGHCQADCADCAKEMMAAATMVKFVGDDGKVIAHDARELLGVKEQETVVIQGTASRDKGGNVSIAADGFFIRR